MKIPLSWVKEFVDITLPLDEMVVRMTFAGLEVEAVHYVGLPMPQLTASTRRETKISGLAWHPEKIVVAAVYEVMPHPNADRLVLCRLDDGQQEHIVLTGAPNLFDYKGKGALAKPLKVAYAKEGAQIYDGHQPGNVVTTLKRAKIRGVDSYSMVCSEKELGISDEHEGIIILDEDAPVGMPLVDYMGDAVLDVAITPNIARDANILGVAREIAAISGQPLHPPSYAYQADGPAMGNMVSIDIRQPELNPRFVLGLIENIEIRPSPYRVQLRLRLAGMRPINNIVDATNYVMLEVGQPLHAFDYDVLLQRTGGKQPTIITRTAQQGERLTTLDGVERDLDDFTVLVCDTEGALSIAGVMGGAESEVTAATRRVLLEGAAWNFINIRKTVIRHHLNSEASYRFSRGVHPAMAERGVCRGLEMMRLWSGGQVYQGLADNYPLPPQDPTVEITPGDVGRILGIELTAQQIADILARLDFGVQLDGHVVRATTPDHRLDIGLGVVGKADLLEEIARVYGYDRIPETHLKDELPPQRGNPTLDKEERIRDLLVSLGLQEVINYRMTHPEREARRLAPGTPPSDRPYVQLANPISSDRSVLRQSLLSSLLEVLERNARLQERIAIFEIGPVFMASEDGDLPDELQQLAIAITGPRAFPAWQPADTAAMDFYDLKGLVDALLAGLKAPAVSYEPYTYPVFHPGKCACITLAGQQLGVIGEMHPQVRERYDLPSSSLLMGLFNLDLLLQVTPERHDISPVPAYPPVLEDLAFVVDEDLPADRVAGLIRQAGGKSVVNLRLFDVYRSEQIGAGKKSLAYSLAYQSAERTLTDKDVAQVRQKIVRRLEQELGAKLRS